MHWYHFIGCFFGGVFLANTAPHFVQGISGNRFPTPFAHPPGKGLSSATVNVAWSLVNLAVGYGLLHGARFSGAETSDAIACFAGIAMISLAMSVRFSAKHSE